MNENKKLPPDFKAKWVAALRSGEYKKGRICLYDSDYNTFCVLGVAGAIAGCDVYSMDKKSNPGYDEIYNHVIPGIRIMSDYSSLDWILDLVHRNDHGGDSFEEIADYIEKNL